MIKIRIGKVEETFEDNGSAMEYVADVAGDSSLRFQRLVFEHGELDSMDFLVYSRGRVSEAYSTRH